MHNYRNLKVWQNARKLVKEIYLLSNKFPPSEKYGLSSQVRNCSVSIISNIAEGAGRGSKPDFKRFLNMALGSSFELESQLIVSNDIGYVSEAESIGIIVDLQEIQKMIYGLIILGLMVFLLTTYYFLFSTFYFAYDKN